MTANRHDKRDADVPGRSAEEIDRAIASSLCFHAPCGALLISTLALLAGSGAVVVPARAFTDGLVAAYSFDEGFAPAR